MTLSLLEKPNATTAQKGLDDLVEHLRSGRTIGPTWPQWLESAYEQLETDTSIDAHLTDNLAEALSEMEELLSQRRDVTPAARRLLSLCAPAPDVEERWRVRAQALPTEQLQTTLWSDLHRALEAFESGRRQVVSRWIDLVESRLLAKWDDYENLDILDEEITVESIAGHHILCDGVEGWLYALAELSCGLATGFVNRQRVLENAEMGQRLLVALEVISKESVSPLEWLVEAWKN